MKKLDYYVLDVFSDEQYKGNPLSVVLMEEELTPNQFKNIAREFGYSETSFVKYSVADNAYKEQLSGFGYRNRQSQKNYLCISISFISTNR